MLSDEALERLRKSADGPDLSGTKYELIGRIARGGMGTVWLVEDRELGRRVALKVMNEVDPGGALVVRFLREAKVIARLEHPGIVPIHEVTALPNGRVAYAMKLVSGRTLRDLVLAGTARPSLLRVFQRACEAVAFAHAHGVIHRDLKPENVMVGAFGEALVIDWGLAKLLDGEAARRATVPAAPPGAGPAQAETVLLAAPAGAAPTSEETSHGTVLGTPSYMAPEQAKGEVERLDARTDVHALGAILYFALAKRPPFEGRSLEETLKAVRDAAPVPPRAIDATVPRALEAIALRALEKDPARRYATAEELAADVGRFLDGEPVSAYREGILERAARLASRHQVLLLLVAAYVLLRVLVLAFARR